MLAQAITGLRELSTCFSLNFLHTVHSRLAARRYFFCILNQLSVKVNMRSHIAAASPVKVCQKRGRCAKNQSLSQAREAFVFSIISV